MMRTPPYLLSIIITCYNTQEFIIECLDSLLPQLDDQVQVILIDDGSNDNSVAQIKGYLAQTGFRVELVINPSNQGIAVTRNIGLQQAQGTYIAFVDGDDRVSTDYYATLRPWLLEGTIELLDFNFQRFTQQIPTVAAPSGQIAQAYPLDSQGLTCLQAVFNRSYWHLWNRIYQRRLLVDAQFDIGRRYEDVMFTPFQYFKARHIVHLEQTLYFYRDNAEGITRNVKKKDIDDMLFAMDKMVNYLQQQPGNDALTRLATAMIENCFIEARKMTRKMYGYYHYDKAALASIKQAVGLLASSVSKPKTRYQMRLARIDSGISWLKYRLKGKRPQA